MDPAAEKYYSWSGYNYVMDSPVRLVDPDGRGVTTDFVNTCTGEHIYINDGVDQIVFVEEEADWGFIERMSIAETWNAEQTYRYDEIISKGALDMNSDLGMLTRIAFAEFTREDVEAKKIAAESVLNRVEYKGIYAKYSPDLNASSVEEAITAPGAYSSVNTQRYIDPYGYLNSLGAEFRDNIGRRQLAEAAYAAYFVLNFPNSRTGVHYFLSPPRAVDYLRTYPAYKHGNMEILNLNIEGISAAGKLTK